MAIEKAGEERLQLAKACSILNIDSWRKAVVVRVGDAPGPVLGCYGRVCAILRLLAQWEPSKTSNYRISKTNPKLDVAGSILHFAQIKATRLQLQFKSF